MYAEGITVHHQVWFMVIKVWLQHSAIIVTTPQAHGIWSHYFPEHCYPMTIYVQSLFSKIPMAIIFLTTLLFCGRRY
jgi:hypothetical protein